MTTATQRRRALGSLLALGTAAAGCGGAAAGLVPGTAVVVTGVRATTIRIER